MKTIPLFKRFNNKWEVPIALGRVYKLTDVYGKTNDALFIKTSAKGFNFLNLKNAKCIFKSALYQTNSVKKTIGRLQRDFEMIIPDHIAKIEQLTQEEIKAIKFLNGISFYAPDKTQKEYKAEEKIRQKNAEEQAIEDHRIINNLSGMEIE